MKYCRKLHKARPQTGNYPCLPGNLPDGSTSMLKKHHGFRKRKAPGTRELLNLALGQTGKKPVSRLRVPKKLEAPNKNALEGSCDGGAKTRRKDSGSVPRREKILPVTLREEVIEESPQVERDSVICGDIW